MDVGEALESITTAIDDLYVQDMRIDLEIYKSFVHVLEGQKRNLNERILPLEYEIPYSRWLFQYVFNTLDKTFVVESQEENIKSLGPR